MNLVIVGGTGNFGKYYAKLFHRNGFNVFIKDLGEEETKDFCESNNYKFADDKKLKEMDIVVIAVPNKVAPELIKNIKNKLKKGTLIFDFCSGKSFVVPELEELKGKGYELASIHPMHGPRVISINNYPIVLIDIETGEKFKKIREMFEKESGNIIDCDYKEHDKNLAIVQGLTHFSQFVSATIIKKMNVDLENTLKFSSPNYSLFIGLMSRVVLQNPEMYSQIQLSNPYNEEIRKNFEKSVKELHELCKTNDLIDLEKTIINDAQVFRHSEIFLIESDKAVKAQKQTANFLKEKEGEDILIENMINHHFHFGKIENINPKHLILTEGKDKLKIAIKKIRVCTGDELRKWKKENLNELFLDYSFFVPKKSDLEKIKQALEIVNDVTVELIDLYENDSFGDKKSITFRVKFFNDIGKESINKEIIALINGLGYELR